jgi:homocitrate synthase NifV
MSVIIDTTLREGEQTPGVRFHLSEKKHIIDGLVNIGIEEIELGIASPLVKCPSHLLRYCRQKFPELICSLWSRCHEKDIHFAASLSPDIISLSIPVSDILIHEKLAKNREWVAQCLQKNIELATRLGMKVAVGFEDATRASLPFLLQMAQLAEDHGAVRVRLADTVGTSSPSEFGNLVSEVLSVLKNTSVSLHCHNDFGMATANAVSGLERGATSADVTLLGLGERCGCTKLEELVGYLKLKKNAPFNILGVPPLAEYTAGLTSRDIPCNQPFLGKEIFTCETGLHLQALQKNPATYEPYPAEMIGADRRFLLGPKAGRRVILSYLKSKGFAVNEDIDDSKMKSIRKYLAGYTFEDNELAAQLNC